MTIESRDVDPIVLANPATPVARPRRGASLLWLFNPRLTLGLIILVVMGLGSMILPFFAPMDPSIQASYMRNLPVSGAHWLGTNSLGQDIFWFLVFAIRNSLALGVLVACGVTFVATIVGLSAGYIGGRFERFVMLIVDTFITIPLLPISSSWAPSFAAIPRSSPSG